MNTWYFLLSGLIPTPQTEELEKSFIGGAKANESLVKIGDVPMELRPLIYFCAQADKEILKVQNVSGNMRDFSAKACCSHHGVEDIMSLKGVAESILATHAVSELFWQNHFRSMRVYRGELGSISH